MRHIYLEEGLRVRFPARSDEFAAGVEIGAVAASMALAMRDFSRRVASTNLDQIQALASSFGYRATIEILDETWAEVTFKVGRSRPALTLVHSLRSEADTPNAGAPRLGRSAPPRMFGAPKRADLRQV